MYIFPNFIFSRGIEENNQDLEQAPYFRSLLSSSTIQTIPVSNFSYRNISFNLNNNNIRVFNLYDSKTHINQWLL